MGRALRASPVWPSPRELTAQAQEQGWRGGARAGERGRGQEGQGQGHELQAGDGRREEDVQEEDAKESVEERGVYE